MRFLKALLILPLVLLMVVALPVVVVFALIMAGIDLLMEAA